MPDSASGAQPILLHSPTYHALCVSFQRALDRQMKTGTPDTTRPIQIIHVLSRVAAGALTSVALMNVLRPASSGSGESLDENIDHTRKWRTHTHELCGVSGARSDQTVNRGAQTVNAHTTTQHGYTV